MARKKYELDEVLKSLRKKNDVFVGLFNIYIYGEKSKHRINDLGNSSWGKIDYLVNYQGYRIMYINNNDTFKQLKLR